MKRPAHTQKTTPPESWPWPVDVSRYDQTPSLRTVERVELHVFINRWKEGKGKWIWTNQTRRLLDRLIRPVQDVFQVTGGHVLLQNCALRMLLREMHERDCTFWAWSQEDWHSILSRGKEFYRQRRHAFKQRHGLNTVMYLLCGYSDLHLIGTIRQYHFARKIFGCAVNAAVQRVHDELLRLGHGPDTAKLCSGPVLCEALLLNRSPRLEDLTEEVMLQLRDRNCSEKVKKLLPSLSRALVSLGLITQPLIPRYRRTTEQTNSRLLEAVAPDWAAWCERWRATSTLAPESRQVTYYQLLQVGRWLTNHHPDVVSPAQWTRALATELVAAVDRMTIGQWSHDPSRLPSDRRGKPCSASAKDGFLGSVRLFFRDCQEWGWVPPLRFDSRRALATPRAIRAQLGPQPRVIASDVWAKLLWAGLNLTAEELPHVLGQVAFYPLEMVKALCLVWLFGGLRRDEIVRLPVGCIRWQREELTVAFTQETLPKDAICLLEVPVNKTSAAFSKPVDRVVGEAIANWERVRPIQPHSLDPKTGAWVDYLFAYRGQRVGIEYINETLIPLLCRKSGAPWQDAKGRITSHRARSTITSQLSVSMSLEELREWLGHRWINSTQYYAQVLPTRLAKSYADAEYFQQNVRRMDVLIDQEAVKSGAAARGEAWKYYDLGHGYCTYDFFEQCPHRMVCAKCSFYVPKASSRAQLLEAKANLQRMKQEIPLQEEERAAVEDGLAAVEKLYERLTDVPTPAGPTPRELRSGTPRELPVLPTSVNH